MNAVYLPYFPKADVNYIYLILLQQVSKYNETSKIYNLVNYSSIADLHKQFVNICGIAPFSVQTLGRLIKDARYKDFLTVDRERKTIILNNDFRKKNDNKQLFVYLTSSEVNKLLIIDDNKVIRYFLLQKFICGSSKTKTHDSTLKQMLVQMGLSAGNNNNLSNLSKYNNTLLDNGLIKIYKFRDNGKERNIYSLQ